MNVVLTNISAADQSRSCEMLMMFPVPLCLYDLEHYPATGSSHPRHDGRHLIIVYGKITDVPLKM